MEQENKTIQTLLKELSDYINEQVGEAIINKQKLHITAPTGTGKTHYIAGLIESLEEEYQVIVLEPQISISGQLSVKLTKRWIQNYIYNSTTKKRLGQFEEESGINWPYTYLSTIDSAYRLFEEGKIDPANTIVIVDESHSFLQSARLDFDRTIRTIKDSGCPVIGFTATESSWVLRAVFEFDKTIKVKATDIPPKKIYPFQVKRGIPTTIAEAIRENKWKKVVIWTETKKDQNKIKEEIQKQNPTLVITVLNADTRKYSEKDAWDYILNNDKFPPGTDVLIMNSVVQSGINILDKDIDAQILVYQFDPLGFLQYLGRARNYTGVFHYFFGDYGSQTHLWQGADQQIEYNKTIQKVLNKFDPKALKKFSEIDPLFSRLYSHIPGVGYIPNQCMIANLAYDSFRHIHGSVLLDIVKQIEPELIIEDVFDDPGYYQQKATQKKATYRGIKRAELISLVQKNATYLSPMISQYSKTWDHKDAVMAVNNSTTDKKDAKKYGILYIPKTKKKQVLDTISSARKAQVGIHRVIVAAKKYLDNGKSLKSLKAVMDMSNQKLNELLEAFLFFEKDHVSDKNVKSILDSMFKHISESKPAKDWIKEINSSLGVIPFLDSLAEKIYRICFVTTRSKVKVNGEIQNGQKLIRLVRTYSDYLKYNGYEEIFAPQ